MFRLASWSVSVLAVAVMMTSLVCGAFGTSFQPMALQDHVAVAACPNGSCASTSTDCLEHCLSRADLAEERLVVVPTSLIVRIFVVPVFLFESDVLAMSRFSAPPWQSHRLFALRE
jgi:hypothetical protein